MPRTLNFLGCIQLICLFAAQRKCIREICGGAPVKITLLFILIFFKAFLTTEIYGQGEQNSSVAPDVVIEKIFLAKDNQGKAGEESENFSTTDIPIYCVVYLKADKPTIVKMNFIAVKVAGVRPETKVISTVYKTDGRQDQVYFTGRPDGFWTAGNYRIDIFVDGEAAGNKEFEIFKSPNEARNPVSPVIKNLVPPKSKPKTAVRSRKN